MLVPIRFSIQDPMKNQGSGYEAKESTHQDSFGSSGRRPHSWSSPLQPSDLGISLPDAKAFEIIAIRLTRIQTLCAITLVALIGLWKLEV